MEDMQQIVVEIVVWSVMVILFLGFMVWLLCKLFLPSWLYIYIFYKDCLTPKERRDVEEALRRVFESGKGRGDE